MARLAPLLALCALLAACGAAKAKPVKMAGAELTPPRVAPAIALHDETGAPFSLATQRGHWVLVTFLYTHCPDVCPLIAQNLNGALHQLGSAANVRVLAVSVDPKGDTPKTVRAYRARLHLVPAFHYLIGTRAQLRPIWAAWNVLAVAESAGLVDHVAYTALVDPRGEERVLYGGQVHAQDVVHDLRALMRKTPPA